MMSAAGAAEKTGGLCLTISAFKSDESVIRLLERAAPLVPALVTRVIVVDSLGGGLIDQAIARKGWHWVEYHNADENLGSAGNLAMRLQMAARHQDCDWALAVNHDGEIQQAAIETLIAAARSRSRVGAVYPLRRLANQEGRFDLSGFSRLPLRRRVSDEKPKGLPEVYWSSSNGALYSLEPARMGLLPRSDLWMGWEDLGYGWALREAGFSQLLATEAEFRDTYEFAALPTSKIAHVSAKPAWYAYYSVRNLILLVRSGSIPMGLRLLVARRIALEVALTATVRRDKRKRWGLIARGIRDGFAGRTGMRVKP